MISDKDWLDNYIKKPSEDQLYRFIEGVGKRLNDIESPTRQQLEKARQQSLANMQDGTNHAYRY